MNFNPILSPGSQSFWNGSEIDLEMARIDLKCIFFNSNQSESFRTRIDFHPI